MARNEFLCISSIQSNRSSYSKIQEGEVFGDHDYNMVIITQFWFPMMVSLLKNFPILLPPNILTLPSKRSAKHPIYPKMKLLAVHSSGKASETQTFQEKLQMLSQIRGEQPFEVGANQFSGDGVFMQVEGAWIPVLQM